jgi:hypothetical protein
VLKLDPDEMSVEELAQHLRLFRLDPNCSARALAKARREALPQTPAARAQQLDPRAESGAQPDLAEQVQREPSRIADAPPRAVAESAPDDPGREDRGVEGLCHCIFQDRFDQEQNGFRRGRKQDPDMDVAYLRKMPLMARTPGAPRARPIAPSTAPCRVTIRRTREGLAPMAMRIPISCDLYVTLYARTP